MEGPSTGTDSKSSASSLKWAGTRVRKGICCQTPVLMGIAYASLALLTYLTFFVAVVPLRTKTEIKAVDFPPGSLIGQVAEEVLISKSETPASQPEGWRTGGGVRFFINQVSQLIEYKRGGYERREHDAFMHLEVDIAEQLAGGQPPSDPYTDQNIFFESLTQVQNEGHPDYEISGTRTFTLYFRCYRSDYVDSSAVVGSPAVIQLLSFVGFIFLIASIMVCCIERRYKFALHDKGKRQNMLQIVLFCEFVFACYVLFFELYTYDMESGKVSTDFAVPNLVVLGYIGAFATSLELVLAWGVATNLGSKTSDDSDFAVANQISTDGLLQLREQRYNGSGVLFCRKQVLMFLALSALALLEFYAVFLIGTNIRFGESLQSFVFQNGTSIGDHVFADYLCPPPPDFVSACLEDWDMNIDTSGTWPEGWRTGMGPAHTVSELKKCIDGDRSGAFLEEDGCPGAFAWVTHKLPLYSFTENMNSAGHPDFTTNTTFHALLLTWSEDLNIGGSTTIPSVAISFFVLLLGISVFAFLVIKCRFRYANYKGKCSLNKANEYLVRIALWFEAIVLLYVLFTEIAWYDKNDREKKVMMWRPNQFILYGVGSLATAIEFVLAWDFSQKYRLKTAEAE